MKVAGAGINYYVAMPKRRHMRKSFQALPLIAVLAVALSLLLAHTSTTVQNDRAHAKRLQQDSPPPVNPGDKDDKPADPPADDPKGNNPQTPPSDPDNKPVPNQPPDPEGNKPDPEPGVPSVPE